MITHMALLSLPSGQGCRIFQCQSCMYDCIPSPTAPVNYRKEVITQVSSFTTTNDLRSRIYDTLYSLLSNSPSLSTAKR